MNQMEMEVGDGFVRTQIRHVGGKPRAITSVRPEVKDALADRAHLRGISLSAYLNEVLANHVGMEP